MHVIERSFRDEEKYLSQPQIRAKTRFNMRPDVIIKRILRIVRIMVL